MLAPLLSRGLSLQGGCSIWQVREAEAAQKREAAEAEAAQKREASQAKAKKVITFHLKIKIEGLQP